MSSVALKENSDITAIYLSFLKKTFDDIDDVILKNKESDADDDHINATQDQREDSNVSLVVALKTDDEAMSCQAAAGVINKKDENDNSYRVPDSPGQETKIYDISDDEPSRKKSKQFTFAMSDLPDNEEIREFLKFYPRPTVTETDSLQSGSESNSDSENENNNWFSRRRRKKTKTVTEVRIDELPTRFITRQRVPNIYLVCKKNCLRVLQSRYLKTLEKKLDEDIIRENINRLKTHYENKGKLFVRIVKPERKDTKYKSFKSTKNSNLNSTPAAKSTTRRTRHLKNKNNGMNMKLSKPHNTGKTHKRDLIVTIEKLEKEDTKSTKAAPKNNKKSTSHFMSKARTSTNTRKTRSMQSKADGKNTKSRSGSSGNVKNNDKERPKHKEERSKLPVLEETRSKRYQKIKVEVEDMTKAPVTIPKKSRQSFESPKSLKRSLVEDSEAPSSKRTRSQSIKGNNSSTTVRATWKTRPRHQNVREKRVRGLRRLDSNAKILKTKTRSHTALRTRGTPRTSTKRI